MYRNRKGHEALDMIYLVRLNVARPSLVQTIAGKKIYLTPSVWFPKITLSAIRTRAYTEPTQKHVRADPPPPTLPSETLTQRKNTRIQTYKARAARARLSHKRD